jgi:hypothetical protein
MNRAIVFKLALLVFAAASAIASPAVLKAQEDDGNGGQPRSATPADNGWPQIVQSDENTVTVYQPQIESWDDNVFKARAAVSVRTKSSAQPTYGVVYFSARTEVDRSGSIVFFEDMKVDRVNFPREGVDSVDYRQVIEPGMPSWPKSMSLQRLEADLAITRAEMKTQQKVAVKNTPPWIIFSTAPAALVLIDGTPVPRSVDGTNLMRIINTRALVLLDRDNGRYYLYLTDHWEEAASVEGPWRPSENPPASLDSAREQVVKSQQVDLMDNSGDQETRAVKPSGKVTLYVSTVPAELIQTRGQPDLQPIDGTRLLTARNSDDNIFMNLSDQNYYILVSGRWYRSASLQNGQWEFVTGEKLPADFANIPLNNPRGIVLASVPGTIQAQEAVIHDSIPQTATVKRSEARAESSYDGEPRFEPVEGTPLYYAVNSPYPVIRVDPESYYSVQNGVWFAATTPYGSWVVAERVPAVIYTIPPSNRLHYVTYVKVYGAAPDVVYVGYTSGYYGSYVGVDGTIVYGTGYVYPAWVGTVWFGPPVTWGFGIHYGWYGGGWGWGWGYHWGYRPFCYPYWGPMWGWHGRHWGHAYYGGGIHVNVNVYNHWGARVVVKGNTAGKNRAVINNNPAYRDYHPAGYKQPPTPPPPQGNHSRSQQGRYNPTRTNTANDHFAGRDGTVYRKTPNGNWEQHHGGNQWSKPNKMTPENVKVLKQADQAREEGNRRAKAKGGYKAPSKTPSKAPSKAPSRTGGYGGHK